MADDPNREEIGRPADDEVVGTADELDDDEFDTDGAEDDEQDEDA